MTEPNFFAGGDFDRAGLLRKDTNLIDRLRAAPGTRIIPVWRDRHLILIRPEPEPVFLTPADVPPLAPEAESMVLLGIIGIFLPILQGFAFIFIGLVMLSIASERVHGWLERLLRRSPGIQQRYQGLRQRLHLKFSRKK